MTESHRQELRARLEHALELAIAATAELAKPEDSRGQYSTYQSIRNRLYGLASNARAASQKERASAQRT